MTTSNNRGRGRTTLVLAAVLVGLVAIAAVVVLILNLVQRPDPVPVPTPSSTMSPEPTEPAGAESICGLEPGSAEVTAAPEASWTVIGRTSVPNSPTAGPGIVDPSGLRHCFAHSPAGALFAAASLVGAAVEGTNREEIAQELVAEGPGRDAAIAQASEPVDSQTFGMSIEGFRVLEYTTDAARVDFALRLTSGEYVSYVVDLRWERGDWKLVLADDGSPLTAPVELQSAGGYITWSSS